jgi:putative transposase
LSLNALAEATIGLVKTKLLYPQGPWRGLDDVEFALLTYVEWFNHRRLHDGIGHVPPAEHEANYYAAPHAAGTQLTEHTSELEDGG